MRKLIMEPSHNYPVLLTNSRGAYIETEVSDIVRVYILNTVRHLRSDRSVCGVKPGVLYAPIIIE